MAGWCSGVGYRLLPVIAGMAFFTFEPSPAHTLEIHLRELRGHSIVSEFYEYISVSKDKKKNRGKIVKKIKSKKNDIYISNTGRIFHRRSAIQSVGNRSASDWTHDNIRSGLSVVFQWNGKNSFVHRSIPSNDKKSATYAMFTKIILDRKGGGFSCTVNSKYVLAKGENEYYTKTDDHLWRKIHNYRSKQIRCDVFKGNVFKGEVGP